MSVWELMFGITLGLCGLIFILGVWIIWSIGPDASRSKGNWDS